MKQNNSVLREYLREKEIIETAKLSMGKRICLAMELSEFCFSLSRNSERKKRVRKRSNKVGR